MKKSLMLKLLAVSALSLACGGAFAASSSADLAVSAAVSKNCTISTTPLLFGEYDPVTANVTTARVAQGKVTVTCAKKSGGLEIGMGDGGHIAGSQRNMVGAVNAELLKYDLLKPSTSLPDGVCVYAGATAWTDTGTGRLTITDPPSKAARTYNVCGSIPGAQDVAVDTYADVVSATINF